MKIKFYSNWLNFGLKTTLGRQDLCLQHIPPTNFVQLGIIINNKQLLFPLLTETKLHRMKKRNMILLQALKFSKLPFVSVNFNKFKCETHMKLIRQFKYHNLTIGSN